MRSLKDSGSGSQNELVQDLERECVGFFKGFRSAGGEEYGSNKVPVSYIWGDAILDFEFFT